LKSQIGAQKQAAGVNAGAQKVTAQKYLINY
jgi:hypothetical protein